jgi:DNA-binding PadR family transcriptional regulator
LVNAGYLETTDRTRNGSSGQARVVRVITDAGREVARGLDRAVFRITDAGREA